MPLVLTLPAVPPGGPIPEAHPCEGETGAPPLPRAGLPYGTVTLVPTCDDADAPRGAFRDGAGYDLAPALSGLGCGEPAGDQAVDDFGTPCGDAPHGSASDLPALGHRIAPGPAARCADIASRAPPLARAKAGLVGTSGR